MNRKLIGLVAAAAIIAGALFIYYRAGPAKTEAQPLYWIDTMEPQIHYPGPGKSRMGMELVPVYPEKQQAEGLPTVKVSGDMAENLAIRTTSVTTGSLSKEIEAVGNIEPNENTIKRIHSFADGWVRNLAVKTAGESVKKGQLLLQLYSPMLASAQEEYLIALKSKNAGLIEASYKRLAALQVSEQQIQNIKQKGKTSPLVDIYAPEDGVLTTLNVREGTHVTPDMEMMSLVDLSTVWLIAEVFEEQARFVKVGEQAETRLQAFPGKVWKGTVDYVYPELDPLKRTLRVRFLFDNPEDLLKPNMYTTVTILAPSKANVVLIPLEAVIRSSKGNRVIVMLNDGGFQVRAVTTGAESEDKIEVLQGLQAGEKIVISGQFLIDSEANLHAGLERLESTPQEPSNHQGMH